MISIKDDVLDLADNIVNNTAAIKNNNAIIVTNGDAISSIDAEVNNNNAIISNNSAAILSNANDITASADFINHAADIAANMLEIAKHPGKQFCFIISCQYLYTKCTAQIYNGLTTILKQKCRTLDFASTFCSILQITVVFRASKILSKSIFQGNLI